MSVQVDVGLLLSSGVTVTMGGLGAMGMNLAGLELGLENNCLLAVSGTGDEYRS